MSAPFNPHSLTADQIRTDVGWYLLPEGAEIREDDGFWHPAYGTWISMKCRPDCLKNNKVNTFSVRRRDAAPPAQTMSDPTNVSELARETALKIVKDDRNVGSLIRMEVCIEIALSKLAAEKDAEITRLKSVVREEWDSVAADKILTDHDKLTADLARYVAALKVARDALEEYRKPEHWILESAEWRWIPDPHLSFVNPHDVSEDALQRIDKELKP